MRILRICLVVTMVLAPTLARGQEGDEDFMGDDAALDDEQDFPDLVRADETGGLMDELALLEDSFLEEEVESASKHRQSIFWSPSAISVYSGDEIRSSGAVALVDFLRRVPGFDVYELKYSYPLIGARALTEEANNLVLVLIDGRESLLELGGMAVMRSLTIHPVEIEKIEIIRGPGSALYGANAFSAVVNITTVADKPVNHARLSTVSGELGHHDLFGQLRGVHDLGAGQLSYSIGLGTEGARSSSDNPTEIMKAFVRTHGYVRYRQEQDLDLSLHAGYVLGDGMFFSTPGDLWLEDAYTVWTMGKTAFSLGGSTTLKSQIYYSHSYSIFVPRTGFRAYDIWVADFPDFPLDTGNLDAQLQLDHFIGEDLLLLSGANIRYIFMESKNHLPSELDELRGAAFVQANWSALDKLQFTGGLRLDLSTEIVPALSPRASVVYRPVPEHSFRLSYGLAFRKPSLYEHQMHSRVFDYNPAIPEVVRVFAEQFGNENLVNEKVHSMESGWQGIFLQDKLRVSVDLFFNVCQDYITFVVELPLRLGAPDLSNATLQFKNLAGNIYAFGGEAAATWRIGDGWTAWANLGLRGALQDGRRRRQEPVLKANLGGSYAANAGLVADLALHYVSRYEMPLKDPRNLLDPPVMKPLGDSFLLLGRLGYRLRQGKDTHLEAGLVIRTPVGEPFREYPGIPMPQYLPSDNASDYAGENLVRMASLYLRGSF